MIYPFLSVSVLSSAVDYTALLPVIITYTINILTMIIAAAVVHTLSQSLVLVQSIDRETNNPMTIALSWDQCGQQTSIGLEAVIREGKPKL